MGGGIAAHLASCGIRVLLFDIVPPNLTDAEKSDPKARNRWAKGGLDKALQSNCSAASSMTATATIVGLLPILWGSGTGSEVMSRLAAPMVGGMLSAVLLTLLVLPVIYLLWRKGQLPSLLNAPTVELH